MKKILFVLMLVSIFSFAQKHPSLALKDLTQSIGEWKGTITYLDYSSGKPFTMAANTTVVLDTANGGKIILKMVYPNEPKANGNDTLQLSNAGTYLDAKPITNIVKTKQGIVVTTIDSNAVDGNDSKPCSIKHLYTFQKGKLVLRKEVLFKGETKWVLRSEYNFKR